MKKVLLTNAYFYRFDAKQWADQSPYPPYGTIYAAALLREEGYEVELFDTNLRESATEIKPYLEHQPDVLVIYDDGFNYLSKMCLTSMRDAALEMITLARPQVKKILVCSSDSTDHAELYLRAGADFVILGEGELSLKELLAKLSSADESITDSLGIAYLKEDQLVKNPRRPVLRDLDSLPDPAWDLIDMASYQKVWMDKWGYFSLNIATTRGCPYKCNWCAKPIYGNRYNSRSPQRVAREMAMLIQDYGAQHFWVCDDIFGLKPKWVQAFRDEVKHLGIQPRYKIQSRADLLLKEDNIDALVESGLEQVWIGAESGSQTILDAMDKGTTIEQIHEATRLLKSKGVEVCFFLQFGYLGETEEDIDKTIGMVKELMPYDIGISVSYPLPGTLFFEKVKAQLDQKQNWKDSDDLAMMYKGTFSPSFYKRLHRYVHKVFRLRQGWLQMGSLLRHPLRLNRQSIRSVAAIAYYLPAMLIDKLRLEKLKSQS
jgi:anaerobic magnesium-protoporphyrin IX monomethyl ester cyclase